MTIIKIRSLIWNDWNKNHIKKHKVEIEEVEEVCSKKYKNQPTYGSRILIFGKTNKGRLLTIVIVQDKKDEYFVVTARDMSKKERKTIYEK